MMPSLSIIALVQLVSAGIPRGMANLLSASRARAGSEDFLNRPLPPEPIDEEPLEVESGVRMRSNMRTGPERTGGPFGTEKLPEGTYLLPPRNEPPLSEVLEEDDDTSDTTYYSEDRIYEEVKSTKDGEFAVRAPQGQPPDPPSIRKISNLECPQEARPNSNGSSSSGQTGAKASTGIFSGFLPMLRSSLRRNKPPVQKSLDVPEGRRVSFPESTRKSDPVLGYEKPTHRAPTRGYEGPDSSVAGPSRSRMVSPPHNQIPSRPAQASSSSYFIKKTPSNSGLGLSGSNKSIRKGNSTSAIPNRKQNTTEEPYEDPRRSLDSKETGAISRSIRKLLEEIATQQLNKNHRREFEAAVVHEVLDYLKRYPEDGRNARFLLEHFQNASSTATKVQQIRPVSQRLIEIAQRIPAPEFSEDLSANRRYLLSKGPEAISKAIPGLLNFGTGDLARGEVGTLLIELMTSQFVLFLIQNGRLKSLVADVLSSGILTVPEKVAILGSNHNLVDALSPNDLLFVALSLADNSCKDGLGLLNTLRRIPFVLDKQIVAKIRGKKYSDRDLQYQLFSLFVQRTVASTATQDDSGARSTLCSYFGSLKNARIESNWHVRGEN